MHDTCRHYEIHTLADDMQVAAKLAGGHKPAGCVQMTYHSHAGHMRVHAVDMQITTHSQQAVGPKHAALPMAKAVRTLH